MGGSGARASMRRGWALSLLGAALLAGCASGNPNTLAPKLVVDAREAGGLTVFVHSAFGERAYDRLQVRLDNATTLGRVDAFSLEEPLDRSGFYLEVEATLETETYEVRGRVDLLPDGESVSVAFVDGEGRWADAREFSLPFERILERRATP